MSDALHIEDSPTHRTTYDELTMLQQEALLEGIRERRLAALRVWKDLTDKKEAVRNEKLREKASKLASKIEKKLAAAEKAILDVEASFKAVKAVLIELEGE